MKFFSIHTTWCQSSLEDIAIHIIGGDWGKDPDFNEEGYESVLCIRGSEFKHWKKNFGNTAVIRKVKTSSLISRELIKNDILVEISGGGPEQPVGRTVLIDDRVLHNQRLPFVCTNFLRLVRLTSEVSASFINRYLEFFYSSGEVTKYQGGSNNLRNLKFKDYSKIEIPLPPLAEQKIIAEKLDTLLGQVDSSKARLEQIPQIMERFRQAVLSAAVSGRLTKTWRNNKEYRYDSSELGTLAKFIDYRGKTPTKTNSGIPLITAKNIRQGYISREPREYIAEADYDKWMTRGIPNLGDVLITTEAPMGYVANINIEEKFALAQRAICLQFKEPIDSYFASIYMQSSIFQQKLNENATGSTVKGIKASLLKKIMIDYPPLPEQQEVVRRVQQLFSYANTIEKQVNSALSHVNNLTHSILAKAFRGELTIQWRAENPELIGGENSAAVLLKKIKIEREEKKILPKQKRSVLKKKTGERMSKQIIKVVEALRQAGEPLSGQQLLAAAGYPGDSSTDDLEKFFLDIRQALIFEKSIVKLERKDDGQDWFSLAEVRSNE